MLDLMVSETGMMRKPGRFPIEQKATEVSHQMEGNGGFLLKQEAMKDSLEVGDYVGSP